MRTDKKKILVLLGSHGAGKTTLGLALPKGQFSYYEELGRRLRSSVNCSVLCSCYLFDQEVMRQELERDEILHSDIRLPIVETWHIGNIAFALARKSVAIADQYLAVVRERIHAFCPSFIFLRISDLEFFKRASERRVDLTEVLSFYRAVEQRSLRLIRQLLGDESCVLFLENNSDLKTSVNHIMEWRRLRP